MPATAFDGSIWVAGGQIAGLVGSTVAFAAVGTLLVARGISRNPQIMPPPEFAPGRRKMSLTLKQQQQSQQTPVALDAESIEDISTGKGGSAEKKVARKDVSSRAKK